MMLIACMARRLNSDVDYAAFRRAWSPDEIIDGDPRRRVLSGINLEDPRDLFTIAIVEDADPEEIPMWMARIAPVEERRHQRIRHLVGEPTLNAVYQVASDDDLSQPIPA